MNLISGYFLLLRNSNLKFYLPFFLQSFIIFFTGVYKETMTEVTGIVDFGSSFFFFVFLSSFKFGAEFLSSFLSRFFLSRFRLLRLNLNLTSSCFRSLPAVFFCVTFMWNSFNCSPLIHHLTLLSANCGP